MGTRLSQVPSTMIPGIRHLENSSFEFMIRELGGALPISIASLIWRERADLQAFRGCILNMLINGPL